MIILTLRDAIRRFSTAIKEISDRCFQNAWGTWPTRFCSAKWGSFKINRTSCKTSMADAVENETFMILIIKYLNTTLL